MSVRSDNDRLRTENDKLVEELREAQVLAESQLRNVERLSTAATRTLEAEAALIRAHRDRADAYRQIADRDTENVTLAKQLEAALAALGALPAELGVWRRVVADFLVEARTGGSTTGAVLAGRLETELAEAGLALGAEVGIRTQLGGAS